MKKLAIVLSVVALSLSFSACEKEDNFLSNDSNSSVLKQQKWNPDDTYPFILPESMQPYQYAVYVDDILLIFDHMQTVFDTYQEGEERGYFMLSYSFDTAGSRINYGFIKESSSYFNSDVFVNNPNYPFVFIADPNDSLIVIVDDDDDDDGEEEEGMVCLASIHVKGFKSAPKMQAWIDKKNAKDGWTAKHLVTCKNKYYAVAYKC